jgi:anti-sigma factor RsiW
VTPRDIACNELVELLTEYLEGALPPDEVVAIDEHLRGCAACRRYLDQLRTTIGLLGSAPVATLPDDTVDALLAAFTRGGGSDPAR